MYYQIEQSKLRIAGTMHFFPADSPEVPDWLREAYEWADELIIESDPPSILPHRELPQGSRLSEILPPPIWDGVVNVWNEALGSLECFKPWWVLLSMPWVLFPLVPGVEAQLIALANEDGKPIGTLESGEDIASLFDQIPPKIYSEILASILEDPHSFEGTLRTVHEAWVSRQLPAIERSASSLPILGAPELRRAVLSIRNRHWLPSLKRAIDAERRTLVLVGALHLCSDDNLVDLITAANHRLVVVG